MDILSERAYQAWPSWAVIYEWENAVSKELGIPIKLLQGGLLGKIQRKVKSIVIDYTPFFQKYYFSGQKGHLVWVMNAKGYRRYMYRNEIPVFLDFPSDMVQKIAEVTVSLPMYWVTCNDIYEQLKAAGSRNVYYMPLSISDENVKTGYVKKSIDVIQFGRRNDVLHEYMLKYIEEKPEVEYVYQTEAGSLTYESTQRGMIGKFSTRKEYLDLLAECRISLVSTPGRDKSRDFGGVDFVTPRFYESAANQCLMIGRYTDNIEARSIGLADICPNISSYEEFSYVVSHYLNDDISDEMSALTSFLKSNVTSRRAMYMKEILAEKKLL